jgi:hypothetical protein
LDRIAIVESIVEEMVMPRESVVVSGILLVPCTLLVLSTLAMTGCSDDGVVPAANDPAIVKARAERTKRLSDPYMDGPPGGIKAKKKSRPPAR